MGTPAYVRTLELRAVRKLRSSSGSLDALRPFYEASGGGGGGAHAELEAA